MDLCQQIKDAQRTSLLLKLFSCCQEQGLLPGFGAQASRCGDFSCWGAQTLGRVSKGSSGPRDWTHASHIAGRPSETRGNPTWIITKLMAQTLKNLSSMQEVWFNPWVRNILWKREWQPTPVFLPGKSHGKRSLVGYSPWGCKESDTLTFNSSLVSYCSRSWLLI